MEITGKMMIESFWQGWNNCASIVLIKAAILRYGMGNVFKEKNVGPYKLISLKDGKKLLMTKEDLKRISKKNRIRFTRRRGRNIQNLRSYVEICFAVIVKNLQMNGYEGTEYTETSAIEELTKNGISTHHLPGLLGLKRKTRTAQRLSKSQLATLRNKKAVLLYSDTHIVIISKGYYEDFGDAVPLETHRVPLLNGRKAKYWYELK